MADPDKLKKAEVAIRKWLEWSFRVGRLTAELLPVDHMAHDAILAYAEAAEPDATGWYPISSLPEGRHVLLYWAKGENGNGGIEAATVSINDDDFGYWTHGGGNNGLDWDVRDNEKPTHWRPLPSPPISAN